MFIILRLNLQSLLELCPLKNAGIEPKDITIDLGWCVCSYNSSHSFLSIIKIAFLMILMFIHARVLRIGSPNYCYCYLRNPSSAFLGSLLPLFPMIKEMSRWSVLPQQGGNSDISCLLQQSDLWASGLCLNILCLNVLKESVIVA